MVQVVVVAIIIGVITKEYDFNNKLIIVIILIKICVIMSIADQNDSKKIKK